MAAFNPDQYLAEKTQAASGFDPDAYLKAKTEQAKEPMGWWEGAGRATVNSLPVLGGIAGGVLSAPLAAVAGPMAPVVGAGLGGMAGSGLKNAINSIIDPDNAPKTLTQAYVEPFAEGMNQAAMQGVGEVAAPFLSKAASTVSDPIRKYLSDKAAKLAVNATGATGLKASRFAPNAGQELLDRGIVSFGNSQEKIAAKASQALDESGDRIGQSLAGLDEQGARIKKSDIVDELRSRATDLSQDPATQDIGDALWKKADKIEGSAAEDATDVMADDAANYGVPDEVSLSQGEKTKRGFQDSVNYNSPKQETSVAEQAADVYRQAVEDSATKVDPDMAGKFMDAKEDYGLLSPIQKAAKLRSMVTQQHPAGGFLDMTAGVVGGAHGGPIGAIAAPIARRVIAPRVTSSAASSADWLSQAVQNTPSSLGKWAPILTQASQRGGNSLGAADYVLQQTDPEYRKHIQTLQGQDQESQ